ncbi:hypothetical protein GCM10010486_66320 [Nonomuraea roseoviolacea subsp. carminata]
MMRRGSGCPRRNGFGKLGRAANASGNGRPTGGTAKGGSRAEAGEALSGTNGQRSKGRRREGWRSEGRQGMNEAGLGSWVPSRSAASGRNAARGPGRGVASGVGEESPGSRVLSGSAA